MGETSLDVVVKVARGWVNVWRLSNVVIVISIDVEAQYGY
jgi:hypothetical protein